MGFKINIVSTGSSSNGGNCIIIDDDLVIDLGVKKKTFIEHFKGSGATEDLSKSEQDALVVELLNDKSAILITHAHGDHLQPPMFNLLHKAKPWYLTSKVYMNENTNERLNAKSKLLAKWSVADDHLLMPDQSFTIDGKEQTYKIKTFELNHDVPNQGFVIENENGETLVYATDTNTMKYCPKGKYDYIMVEGNYDESRLEMDLLSDDEELYRRAKENMRHLSIQQFENFVRSHAKPSTIVYQLHESGDYGFRSDLINELKE